MYLDVHELLSGNKGYMRLYIEMYIRDFRFQWI